MGTRSKVPNREYSVIFLDDFLIFPKAKVERIRYALEKMRDSAMESSNEIKARSPDVEVSAFQHDWEEWQLIIDMVDSQLLDG